LRLSENYVPDLVHIDDGKVEDVQLYKTLGSGSGLAQPLLEKRYSHTESVDEALPSSIEILNSVLEDHSRFRGYQLVVVKRLADGRDEIKTAQDCKAQSVKLENICWLDSRFYPLEKSPKHFNAN
jgi:20S proteasome alpha/beta subunit